MAPQWWNEGQLSERECEIVPLVAQDLGSKEIAYRLGLAEGTVNVFVARACRKLDFSNRRELGNWYATAMKQK